MEFGNFIKKISIEELNNTISNDGSKILYDNIILSITLFKDKCTDDEVERVALEIENILDKKFFENINEKTGNIRNIGFHIEPVSEKEVNGYITTGYNYYREYDIKENKFVWNFYRYESNRNYPSMLPEFLWWIAFFQ